jgi:alpha-tubulin suppressor-like RCC1 family protein
LKADGTVVAWGDNGSGQLGNNTFTSSSVPVAVSSP